MWIVLLLVAVVLVAYVGAARRSEGPPLDPDSTSPDGTKALVELIGRIGGGIDVVEAPPGPDVEVALVVEDQLSRAAAREVTGWVRDGGTLVVADPTSLLSPSVGAGIAGEVRDDCPVPVLRDVAVVDVGVSRGYEVPTGATGCFETAGGDAFLVVQDDGEGTVVSLGGPWVFTNALLDQADNAVLAAALLGNAGGRVVLVSPPVAGEGERTLLELIDAPVRAALAQLAVVFVVVVLWRGRRLGRPVEEPQPVQVDGSELTRAVGRLLQTNRRPGRAAAILRDHSRRDLSGLLGLPLDAPIDVVQSTIAARTSLDDAQAHRAAAAPVTSDGDLVEVANLLSRIREELTHDRSARNRT